MRFCKVCKVRITKGNFGEQYCKSFLCIGCIGKGWKLIDIGKNRRQIAAAHEITKRKHICEAMIKAGIVDPESLEGKRFCTDKCPYDRCIVFEAEKSPYTVIRNKRAERAKLMAAEGHSVGDIAAALRMSTKTIGRYLAK